MNLTKKQVKALLEVISSDESRPVLTHAYIDQYEGNPVLVATNSYMLTALRLSDDVLPNIGQWLPRAELIKWYKLASNKDLFTETELISMLISTDDMNYPKWQPLIPTEIGDIAGLNINADLLVTLQNLSGNVGMDMEFHGDPNKPVTVRNNGNLYLIMPLKR